MRPVQRPTPSRNFQSSKNGELTTVQNRILCPIVLQSVGQTAQMSCWFPNFLLMYRDSNGV